MSLFSSWRAFHLERSVFIPVFIFPSLNMHRFSEVITPPVLVFFTLDRQNKALHPGQRGLSPSAE